MRSRTSTLSQKNTTVINFARSRAFDRFSCTVSKIQNTGLSRLISPWEVVQARFRKKIRQSKTLRRVEFRSIFHAPSRKFKILVFPVLFAHGKLYKHAFAKKYDGHKLCAKSRAESSFDRFFVHRLGNSKY
ncbi:hypothetical protein BHE74_00059197 [Ensete ventricosum]|nr:hypothetical protein BHE74_00059197 [Ensete ventricosum]